MKKKLLLTCCAVAFVLVAIVLARKFFRPPPVQLLVHCAASLRTPVEEIARSYFTETGVQIQLQYGGSQQLLAAISATRTGDLFIPAAHQYLAPAQERGELGEVFPLASMRVVVAVKAGNPKGIASLADLLKPGVRVSLPDPESAAAGMLARAALGENWKPLMAAAVVTKPTVTDSTNDVKLGSADACLVFNAVAAQFPGLEVVAIPELAEARAGVVAAVLNVSTQFDRATQFARFLAAPATGGVVFKKHGYAPPGK